MKSRELINAFPLQWPSGWKRATTPIRAKFNCIFGTTRDRIVREIGLMGIGSWNVIISTNVELRRDGLPYSGRSEPPDRGVAVYWFDGNNRRVIACDRWDLVKDNMRAIEKTLDAMRGLDRWGTSEIMDRVFAGFRELPPAGDEMPAVDDWRMVLGFTPYVDVMNVDILRARYLELANEHHPDRGGDSDKMKLINRAYCVGKAELEQ